VTDTYSWQIRSGLFGTGFAGLGTIPPRCGCRAS